MGTEPEEHEDADADGDLGEGFDGVDAVVEVEEGEFYEGDGPAEEEEPGVVDLEGWVGGIN